MYLIMKRKTQGDTSCNLLTDYNHAQTDNLHSTESCLKIKQNGA